MGGQFGGQGDGDESSCDHDSAEAPVE
jgi:hypothetical protein